MNEYISREKALKMLQMQLLDLEVDQDKGEYSELCENRGARDALDNAIYDIRTIKAADVQPVSQWISVEDKLPIEKDIVLCYVHSTTGEGNCLGTLRNGEFWLLQVDGKQLSFPCLHLKVTHWMPLPKPPKECEVKMDGDVK
jgi:hypothetical protein